jgi:hypothetical protein
MKHDQQITTFEKHTMKDDTELNNTSGNTAESRAFPQTVKTGTATPSFLKKAIQSARPHNKTVTIEAKIDVGFGNALYLRGEGPGLSWDTGIPLKCVDSSTWKWSGLANNTLKFKLLLNDSVWSKGEDLTAAPGQKVEVAPAF